MKKTSIESLAREDAFQLIGKEWMLITAGTLEKHNMMTASWGGIGWLWNKPVAFIFVRPERFTYPLIEENEHLTLSFLGTTKRCVRYIISVVQNRVATSTRHMKRAHPCYDGTWCCGLCSVSPYHRR